MCSRGGAGGGGRQNPQHGDLGASPLVGGLREDLAQLESQIEVEGMVLA